MNTNTTILGIDTSTSCCWVALYHQGMFYSVHETVGGTHSAQVFSLIQAVLSKADCSFAQIEALAVGLGPGSFTGLRLGLSVMKGLAVGLNLPLRGVSSLKAVACGIDDSAPLRNVVVLSDARRGEFYSASYKMRDENIVEVHAEAVRTHAEVDSLLSTHTVLITVDCEYSSGQKRLNSDTGKGVLKIALQTPLPKRDIKVLSDLSPQYLRKVSARSLSDRNKREKQTTI